jgi:hypothetical protein
MRNLPSAKQLAEKLQGLSKVKTSLKFLHANRNVLKGFQGAEDFGCVLDDRPDLSGFHHHLVNVRAAILRELWRREIFIGISVIDDLFFDAVRDDSIQEPVRHVLEVIRDHGIHRPGFVVYPVHSLGVLGAGLFAITEEADFSFFIEDYGLAVRPQSNSSKKALAFLDDVRKRFGVAQHLPQDLIEHWRRSRRLTWLETNPLLALRMQSFPGSYYENQSLLIAKLQFAASLIFMFSALEHPRSEHEQGKLFSSAYINNWQTLDLHHYLVLFRAPRGKELSGDCVPMMMMNQSRPALVELTDLGVELNPAHWRKETALGQRVVSAMQRVQEGYFKHRFITAKDSAPGRVHRKLFNALKFFRRTFRTTGGTDEALVNLGAAFDVLLTDFYSPGVKERLKRRLALAVKGAADAKAMVETIERIYEARSEAIHTGDTNVKVDLHAAQRTFVYAFMGVAERLNRVDKQSNQPIADILGEKHKEEPPPASRVTSAK